MKIYVKSAQSNTCYGIGFDPYGDGNYSKYTLCWGYRLKPSHYKDPENPDFTDQFIFKMGKGFDKNNNSPVLFDSEDAALEAIDIMKNQTKNMTYDVIENLDTAYVKSIPAAYFNNAYEVRSAVPGLESIRLYMDGRYADKHNYIQYF